MNLLTIIILLVLLVFAINGYMRGFARTLTSLLFFVFSGADERKIACVTCGAFPVSGSGRGGMAMLSVRSEEGGRVRSAGTVVAALRPVFSGRR